MSKDKYFSREEWESLDESKRHEIVVDLEKNSILGRVVYGYIRNVLFKVSKNVACLKVDRNYDEAYTKEVWRRYIFLSGRVDCVKIYLYDIIDKEELLERLDYINAYLDGYIECKVGWIDNKADVLEGTVEVKVNRDITALDALFRMKGI